MTVLRGNEVRGFNTESARRYMVGAALVLVGIVAALGISRLVDSPAYQGALVDRSMAMEANTNALVEGGYATAGYLNHSPMVKRSLAMEEYYKANAAGSTHESPTGDQLAFARARAAAAAAGAEGTNIEPAVKRSLAMQEFYIPAIVKRSLAMESYYND